MHKAALRSILSNITTRYRLGSPWQSSNYKYFLDCSRYGKQKGAAPLLTLPLLIELVGVFLIHPPKVLWKEGQLCGGEATACPEQNLLIGRNYRKSNHIGAESGNRPLPFLWRRMYLYWYLLRLLFGQGHDKREQFSYQISSIMISLYNHVLFSKLRYSYRP